jgi:hypothetical protein
LRNPLLTFLLIFVENSQKSVENPDPLWKTLALASGNFKRGAGVFSRQVQKKPQIQKPGFFQKNRVSQQVG